MDFLHYDSDNENDNVSFKSEGQKSNDNLSLPNSDRGYSYIETTDDKHKLLETYLPPLTRKNVNIETIRNVEEYKKRATDFTESLRSNKQFGNPYILTKVVKTLGIDEIGSNYSNNTFDPHGYHEVRRILIETVLDKLIVYL